MINFLSRKRAFQLLCLILSVLASCALGKLKHVACTVLFLGVKLFAGFLVAWPVSVASVLMAPVTIFLGFITFVDYSGYLLLDLLIFPVYFF